AEREIELAVGLAVVRVAVAKERREPRAPEGSLAGAGEREDGPVVQEEQREEGGDHAAREVHVLARPLGGGVEAPPPYLRGDEDEGEGRGHERRARDLAGRRAERGEEASEGRDHPPSTSSTRKAW